MSNVVATFEGRLYKNPSEENETNVFTSGDFSQYKDIGEARINEQYCEDIFNKIKDYEYGFVADGERFNDDSSFDWRKYRLSSPTEFEKNKIGICWDYCEYIADALDKKGIKYNLYFLNLITGEGEFTTHTFIVADTGDNAKTYIECAYKKYMMCETHYDMKDIFELSDVIAQRMLGDIADHSKQEYDLYEYTNSRPKIGSTSDEFMEYIWEHGTKICEHRHIEDTFKGRAYDEETIVEYSTNGLEAKYGYFGSPNDLGNKLVLTRPMFVTPLPGIASMFCLPRDSKFYREEIGAHGMYNKEYDEWDWPESKLQKPLEECHVIIQGGDKPISPKTMEFTGYIYKIDLDRYRDYLKPRHAGSETDREFLIDGVAEVEFISIEPHTITAHFRQEAARPKLEQADEYGIKDGEATITDPDGNKTNVRVKLGGVKGARKALDDINRQVGGSLTDDDMKQNDRGTEFRKRYVSGDTLNANECGDFDDVTEIGRHPEEEDCKYTGDMLTPRIIPSDCKHRSLVVQPNGPNIIYIPKHEVERLFNHEHREHHDRDILTDLCMRAKGCNPDELHVDIVAIIDNGKERYDDILRHAPVEKVKFIKACIDPSTYKLRKNLVLEWLSFQHDPLDVYEYTFDGTDIRTYCEMFNCGTANFFSDVHEFIEREQIDEQFVYITMEEKLSTEDREQVKYWGLPSQKKYPLPDESHVRSALRFFKDCPEKDRPELARNIVKRAKQLNMDWTKWDQLKPYLSKTMQKQFKE